MNISDNYAVFRNYGNHYAVRPAQTRNESAATKRTDTEKGTVSNGSGLSAKAQELLKKLNQSNSNVEFMAVEKGEDAEAALAGATKEFSVVLTNEELEKMAADEDYEKECMSRVEGAIRMSEQINQEFGMESGSEKVGITKMGVSFDENGTATYFAELTKTISARKEQVEKAAEKRAEEKRQTEELTKKVLVTAGSANELSEKIRNVDWDAVESFEEESKGRIFDYHI